MRKLVLQMQCTVDGFIGGPNGELEWAFPDFDAEYDAWGVPKLWDASLHLMGSVTYGEMAAHWPASKQSYAPPMNEIPKIVFSRNLKAADWKDTTIMAGDLGQEIARLKQGDGKPLLAHGGARFARSLIKTGLIDEYRLIVHPVVLGEGRKLFAELPATMRLTLGEIVPFKTGTVAKTYRV